MTDLAARIAAYLSGGGLFNPEQANHDAVRDLILDCRARIEELEKALEPIAAMQPILARPLVAGATDMPDDAYVGGGITYGMLRAAARTVSED